MLIEEDNVVRRLGVLVMIARQKVRRVIDRQRVASWLCEISGLRGWADEK